MSNIEILYQDEHLLFCIKPSGINSTDIEGGFPNLVRAATGRKDVFTVHRLDQVVSGLMVLAFEKETAKILSEQLRSGEFQKTYLAVVDGVPEKKTGKLVDYLQRDKSERKTIVVPEGTSPSQKAELDYFVMGQHEGKSLVKIRLHTGRTHQIRCQFSSRNMPVLGDRKYSDSEWDFPIALWSEEIRILHPITKKQIIVTKNPPKNEPWSWFDSLEEINRVTVI